MLVLIGTGKLETATVWRVGRCEGDENDGSVTRLPILIATGAATNESMIKPALKSSRQIPVHHLEGVFPQCGVLLTNGWHHVSARCNTKRIYTQSYVELHLLGIKILFSKLGPFSAVSMLIFQDQRGDIVTGCYPAQSKCSNAWIWKGKTTFHIVLFCFGFGPC